MDFNKLKGLASEFGSGSSSNDTQDGQQQQQQQQQQQGEQAQTGATNTNTNAAGTEDYGDKGLDFLEKKAGYSQSRETNEKITDGARGLYEKFSGSKLDSKYSN